MNSVVTNFMAMNASRQFHITSKSKNKNMEKLSSGYKVIRAADDAAGLSISEKMRRQIRGLNQGSKNVEDGISFCNTAEGALQEVHNILGRMRELAVKAANDVNASEDRSAINDEIKELKTEINRISRNTEFNSIKIFQRPMTINFSDDIQVVQIFDANDGDPNDPDSYGGIILNGRTRVPWKEIDPDMVYTDPDTGETLFHAGAYSCNAGGFGLLIECEEGSKPPEITAQFEVTPGAQGIQIAGDLVSWADVLNDDGVSILNVDPSDINGYYHFQYGTAIGDFCVTDCNSLQDVIDGLNRSNTQFCRRYLNVYDGYYKAKAIDIVDSGSQMRIDNSIITALQNHTDLDAHLQADDDGIWVVDAAGNSLADSKKTWADLGIHDWGSKISSDISDVYRYTYRYNANGYDIKFKFTLLDETSKESVIQGINNGCIDQKQIVSNNETTMEFTSGNAILDGKIAYTNNKLSAYEEADLGRDFSQQSAVIANKNMTYDAVSNQFSLEYDNVSTSSPELKYTSYNVTNQQTIQKNAETYLAYLSARKVQQLVNNTANISNSTLADVVGAGKVTSDGHLSETVVINKSRMVTTSNIKDNIYPCASIDFSTFGTDYDLFDLLGTGFNSTCKTCDNHYSVMFTYGNATSTTSNGYGYTRSDDGQGNYMLMVDLKTFQDKGIQSADQFTKALVNVLDESQFDFHFTQYATDGSKFYICDNRPQNTGTTFADFDTKPYSVGECIIDIGLREADGTRTIDLQYKYDIASGADATANMTIDVNGSFVEDTVNGGYKLYKKSDYYDENGNLKAGVTAPTRYQINLTNTVSSWDDYYDDVMTDISAQSKIKLSSTDYDYIGYAANEGTNSATVSTFDFEIRDTKDFWIQSGANAGEGMYMKWDPFSLYTLGLGNANTLTRTASESLLQKIDHATNHISEMRSGFGAYTNRMEHMYANNMNYSENLQQAESNIRDTDMAEEMMNYSKHNILEQVGQAMIAQANQQHSSVLSLLQ